MKSTTPPSTKSRKQILVIDDDASILEVLSMRLESKGYEVTPHGSGRSAELEFGAGHYHAALVDLKLDRENGIQVMTRLQAIDPTLPVIIMTAYGTIGSTVEAMRLGASGYVTKPFKMPALLEELERALAEGGQMDPEQAPGLHEIIGNSPPMMRVKQQILKIAGSNATVLIMGESGTGKELVARAIHWCSKRSNGPFLAVNCGAVPESLQESELFGHVRGAFTGAIKDKKGLFVRASSGTLLLDEIAETSPALQVKLLRVLQDGDVSPVGGNRITRVDVRLLASTNRQLELEVEKGSFRQDLFYRLHVIPITMPPLRDRKEDIPLLASHFLQRNAKRLHTRGKKLSQDTLDTLSFYNWPGNVRELQNILERAMVTSASTTIQPNDLGLAGINIAEHQFGDLLLNLPPGGATLEEIEKEALLQALRAKNWVQKQAGEMLGISPRVMTYKLQKYGIRKERKE